MVIYLDIYLLENFIVNFFLLYITMQSIKFNGNMLYIFLASLMGSVYAGIIIIYPLKIFINFPFKLCVAFFMVFICLRKFNILFELKAGAIFILYSALLGGLCIFIQFGFKDFQYRDGLIINFSYKKLMLALMISYILATRLVVYVKDRKETTQFTYDVNIKLKNTTKTVQAFLDTGSQLREPATNLPVMILEKGIISQDNIKEYKKFYIPYKVVNGSVGNLEGFKPEYITINIGKKRENREVIIALCDIKLDSYDEFQALLSRGII